MKFRKYQGHLCTVIFDTSYQRVSQEIKVRGYLIPVMQNNKVDYWVFCNTEDEEVMQEFFDGITEDELTEISKRGVKKLPVSASDLLAIGNQHRGNKNFGYFQHQTRLKFVDDLEEWLLT